MSKGLLYTPDLLTRIKMKSLQQIQQGKESEWRGCAGHGAKRRVACLDDLGRKCR